MPKFIDYHAHAPEMPPEAVQGAIAAIKAGKPDEFGVTPALHIKGVLHK